MPDIESPYHEQSGRRFLVAYLAAQGVARVGWIDDDAALSDDVNRLLDEPVLGIVEMNIKKLGHGFSVRQCAVA